MSITLKRNQGRAEAEAALARLRQQARERADQLGPYAAEARANAAKRVFRAREWTAPRLAVAAHRVEDTMAPRIAEFLTSTARRVEPAPPQRARRRLPRTLLVAGVGALGAATVYGALRLRQAAQDAEWQENLNSAREQVRETKEQIAAKAHEAQAKLQGTADEVAGDAKEAAETASKGSKDAASDLNGHVRK